MRLNEIENHDEIKRILLEYYKISKKYSIVNGVVNARGTNVRLIKKTDKLPPINIINIAEFDCSKCELTSLIGCPKHLSGRLVCTVNKLTNFIGCPVFVNGSYYFGYNLINSFEGLPDPFYGRLFCDNNELTSFKGAPKYIDGNIDCSDNPIISFDGIPDIITGSITISYNSSLPMLKLLSTKQLNNVIIRDDDRVPHETTHILNKYLGKGKSGMLACAAELTKAGFKSNARM